MFQQARMSAVARRQLLLYGALPIAYIIFGRLGLLLAVPPGYATAVFLPAGIAVAAMFMAGAATLAPTFAGSFLLNLWIGYFIAHRLDAAGLSTALLIALASTIQAAVGGAALRKLVGYPAAFDTPRDIVLFLLLSPLCCLTSTSLSVAGMLAVGVIGPPDLATNWMTWWVGDTLGVLTAVPLMLAIAGEPRTLRQSRLRFVAVPMIVCFALFIGIFSRVTRWEQDEALLEFRMQSQRVADLIRASLDEQALFLDQLASAFATRTQPLTRQNFHDLVQKLLQRFPTIQAAEWAPRVSQAERAAFEAAEQAELPGFAIRERTASGELPPAGDRSEFFPVTYIEPHAGNMEALGFELASSPQRRAAVESAIARAAVTATAPIRLVQERGSQPGILLMQAVPAGPNGSGLVLIVLRMETFARNLVDPLAATLRLQLVDAAAGQPLFDDVPGSAPAVYQTAFDFGTRRYVVQTVPSPVYLNRHRGWQSWTVLAAGVLGTGLLGALLMLGTGHAYRVEGRAQAVRARERELEIVINRTPFMLTRCSRDLRYLFVSDAYAAMIARRPEDVAGKPIVEIMGEQGLQDILPHIEKVLHGHRVEYESEVNYEAIGTRSLSVVYTPERDEQGNVNGWVASILDVTERKRAEEALRAREAELDTIVRQTPFILIRCSPDLRYRFVSEAYARMLGRRPEDIVGKTMGAIIGEDGLDTVLPHIKKVLQGERAEYESEIQYRGVGKRWLHGVYTSEKDEQGNVIGWIASIADITERKHAEEQRDLLVAELSHRVKNTLATVISIARQSFSKARSLNEAVPSFDDRIRALAHTHARLAEANWSGVSLAAIVRDETAPYHDGGSNVRVAGPDIMLSPKTAVSLGMAIHELTMNAAKHGALSAKGGSLNVTWQRTPSHNQVEMSWIESGGPKAGSPQHSGFGRTLLERTLASDLNGEVSVEFTGDGLRCRISFPLERELTAPVAPTRGGDLPQRAVSLGASFSEAGDRSSSETRVMIVEDEALLAMELETLLQSAGCTVIGPFSNLEQAREAVHGEAINIALLDTNLNGEMVYPLADDLAARGVPFIFVTGYGASHLPERFRAAPRVSKPYDPSVLRRELERAGVVGSG
jgi:PAS domain S-box-containing protein